MESLEIAGQESFELWQQRLIKVLQITYKLLPIIVIVNVSVVLNVNSRQQNG